MSMAGIIGAELERHRAEMGLLVSELRAMVLAGPENPRVRKLAPRCGVVRFSDFAAGEFAGGKTKPSNWSAEYHDFRVQYEAVAAAIDAAWPDRAVYVVAEAGSVRVRGNGFSWTLGLHPDVVEYLKGVLA